MPERMTAHHRLQGLVELQSNMFQILSVNDRDCVFARVGEKLKLLPIHTSRVETEKELRKIYRVPIEDFGFLRIGKHSETPAVLLEKTTTVCSDCRKKTIALIEGLLASVIELESCEFSVSYPQRRR